MRSFLTRLFLTLTVTAGAVLCSSFRLEASSPAGGNFSSPIEVDRGGAVLLPVMVNGEGPFAFLVDTGATSSAIADTLARRLNLDVAGKTMAATSAGSATFDVVNIGSLRASGRDAANLRVAVIPSAALANAAARAVGILGQDVLREASFTIDYEHSRFAWTGAGDPKDSARALTLRWAQGRWLVSLPQDASEGRALWMVADSGAAAVVFFDRGTPLGLQTSRLDMPAGLTTVTGAKAARGVMVRSLRAGPAVFRDLPAVIIERRSDEADSDGLLPLCAFARVTFDVDAGTLTVRPRR